MLDSIQFIDKTKAVTTNQILMDLSKAGDHKHYF
jgi:hypothetical protein